MYAKWTLMNEIGGSCFKWRDLLKIYTVLHKYEEPGRVNINTDILNLYH